MLMSCVNMYERVCSCVLSQSWKDQSRENDALRRRRERERERRARGSSVSFSVSCLAVISMGNLASERTPVYLLGFAALLNKAVCIYLFPIFVVLRFKF